MKLITTACAIGALMVPIGAFGATWPVYLVANCSSSDLTSDQASFCEGDKSNCASSSTALAPNSTYDICGLIKFGTNTYIGCFTDINQCEKVSSCGDGYIYASQHAITPGNIACGIGAVCYINNTEQFECCQYDTQYSAWTEYASEGYAQRYVQYCNTSGSWVSATTNTNYVRRGCLPGYYGTYVKGLNKPTCTQCPSSGGVYGTSAAGSTAITECYIPSNTSITDSTGTYEFTDNCDYKN